MKIKRKVDKWGNIMFVNEHKKFHREDGPALILLNGTKEFRQNGLLHRTDGPAIEYSNGAKIWYIEGKHILVKTQEEFERYMRLIIFR